jgi:hypothetical protein
VSKTFVILNLPSTQLAFLALEIASDEQIFRDKDGVFGLNVVGN